MVNPTTGTIAVPQSACVSDITVPSSATSPGVSNADFVAIVTAGQTSGSTIAFAGFCAVDADSRPVIGFINFGPNFVGVSSDDESIRIAIHEMMHALGFSSSYFGSFYPASTVVTETRRGGTVTVIAAPAVVAAARTYFNCSTLTGPELEDEGGSGTALSHWKRRSQRDDVMAGIIDGALISTITLAMFEASGRYTVNYSVAEATLRWGRDAGCGFFASRCDTTAGGLGREFCLSGNNLCTLDLTGYGPCGIATFTGSLPSNQRYFSNPAVGGSASLMSFCPIVTAFSNAQCDDPTSSANSSLLAEAFVPTSRCIVTSDGFVLSGSTLSSALPRRCMPVRCNADSTVVSLLVGATWVTCPSNGQEAIMSGAAVGYDGTFTCPAAATMCSSLATSSIAVVLGNATAGGAAWTTGAAVATIAGLIAAIL